jgi:cell division transport system permease protein
MRPTQKSKQSNSDRKVTYSHYTRAKYRDQSRPGTELSTGKAGGALRKTVHHIGMKGYFVNHMWTLVSTLGQMSRVPFSTFITAMVIGIALALPMGFYVILSNVQQLTSQWDSGAQISLFLKKNVDEKHAHSIADHLRERPEISKVIFISQQPALNEFRQYSGFGDALTLLDENPLPSVLMVFPGSNFASSDQVQPLLNSLKKLPEVDLVQLDMEWLKRFNAFIEIAQRGILLIAGLLALAILVIIGNTIRLTIQNRRQEIEITKLIGGTDAFIRRPFLYCGFFYGLSGAIIAWLLVFIFFSVLSVPIENLSKLYNTDFSLGGLDTEATITLILSGILLGLIGSWISVGQHLKEIEPV